MPPWLFDITCLISKRQASPLSLAPIDDFWLSQTAQGIGKKVDTGGGSLLELQDAISIVVGVSNINQACGGDSWHVS